MADTIPTIRERLGRWLMGDSVDKARVRLEQTADLLMETYQRGPALLPTEELFSRVQELDPQLQDLLITQMTRYEYVMGTSLDDNQIRLRAVNESRYLAEWDVSAQQIIRLWTDYGFGLKTDIIPRDEDAQEKWDEFWGAIRNNSVLNEREIHQLSNQVLTDGEIFITLFFNTMTGEATIRIVNTDEITKIVTLPDDAKTPVYYQRQYTKPDGTVDTLYYPDWRVSEADLSRVRSDVNLIPADSKFANTDENPKNGKLTDKNKTAVVMLHVAHNKKKLRGWPLLKAGTQWIRARNQFVKDRAAVMASRARNVEKITAKTGQRGIDQLRQSIDSTLANTQNPFQGERNPAPVAGSIWLQNEQLDRVRQDLSTGAGDAEKDAGLLTGMAGLAGGIFPHYLGMGESFRLATATAMEGPVLRAFQRYQNFWSSVWRDLVKAVLMGYERYGKASFETNEVDINSDAILQIDIAQLSTLLDSISKLVTDGTIEQDSATNAATSLLRMGMSVLGTTNVDELIPMPGTATEMAKARLANLSEGGYDEYWKGIKGYVRGLWDGSYTEFDFVDGMVSMIQRRLTQAWQEGAASCGITPEDYTDKEKNALSDMINSEYKYVVGFARAIQDNSKENDGALAPLLKRGELWLNRYNDARNYAGILACSDEKKEWIYGDTQHCSSCKKLNGKVKRASTWEELEIRPQNPPNFHLDCKGYKCQCKLEKTTKPLSRGPLPNLP